MYLCPWYILKSTWYIIIYFALVVRGEIIAIGRIYYASCLSLHARGIISIIIRDDIIFSMYGNENAEGIIAGAAEVQLETS